MEEPRYRGPAYETARLKLAKIKIESGESRGRAALYLLQTSLEVLKATRASLWLLRDGGRRIECEHSCVEAGESRLAYAFSLAETGTLQNILQQRKLVVVPQQSLTSFGLLGARLREGKASRVVCVPLFRETRAIGMLTFELDATRETDDRHLAFASTAADFTSLIFEQAERLELEVALQAASEHRAEVEKMQALVRLSRSVAHDLNGLLTIVSAASEELREDSPNLAELAADLAHVANLGKDLTERLLTFGGEPTEGTVVDLDTLIPEVAHVVRPLFSGARLFSTAIVTKSAQILADPLAVKRALINLMKNASEAIGDSGNVQLVVRDPTPDDPLRVDAIVVDVSDTGIGMDEATQARAIEPYFTTKSDGHGLGLSEVFGIAHRFGGGVRVQSAKNRGTTISVAFPKA